MIQFERASKGAKDNLSLIRKSCFHESHCCAPPKTAVCTRASGAPMERNLDGVRGHMGDVPLHSALLWSNTPQMESFSFVKGGQRGKQFNHVWCDVFNCFTRATGNNCPFRLSTTGSSPSTVHMNLIFSSLWWMKSTFVAVFFFFSKLQQSKRTFSQENWASRIVYFQQLVPSHWWPVGDLWLQQCPTAMITWILSL